MLLKPGDIVIAKFPFTDLLGNKRRPSVILAKCDVENDYVIAYITTNQKFFSLPSAITVDPILPGCEVTRLKSKSTIRADKLATIHSTLISGRIGVLPENLLMQVHEKIHTLLHRVI